MKKVMPCPNCNNETMKIVERDGEKDVFDVVCAKCDYTVWGELIDKKVS